MSYFADVAALARKDLLLELRARDTVPAMLLFVLATFVVFHFVLPSSASELATKGLLWVAITFTAILGLTRAFAAERDEGVIDALVLAARDRSAIWLGKALSVLAFLVLAELVALPAFALFFSAARSPGWRSRTWASARSGRCSPAWRHRATPANCCCHSCSCRWRSPS